MNILVTSGAGFIGSHLVDRLLAEGNKVRCIDNFDPFYDSSVKEYNITAHLEHPNYCLVEEDTRNLTNIKNQVEEPVDVIVHLAAKGGVRPPIKKTP